MAANLNCQLQRRHTGYVLDKALYATLCLKQLRTLVAWAQVPLISELYLETLCVGSTGPDVPNAFSVSLRDVRPNRVDQTRGKSCRPQTNPPLEDTSVRVAPKFIETRPAFQLWTAASRRLCSMEGSFTGTPSARTTESGQIVRSWMSGFGADLQ